MKFKSFGSLIVLVVLSQLFNGCAVVTALKQPEKKNLQVLNQGISRDNVIAFLGAPITSEKNGDNREEIYKFRQGYSGGNKASRALFHAVADLFTIFIWEVIAWPMESVVDGNDMTIKVIYDQDDKLVNYTVLQGA